MASPSLCRAIDERRVIAFVYRGLERVVASYCHGFTKEGREVLRAVQLRGQSASESFGLGKLWLCSEIRGLRILDEAFVPDDPKYNPDDSAMARIHCRVVR